MKKYRFLGALLCILPLSSYAQTEAEQDSILKALEEEYLDTIGELEEVVVSSSRHTTQRSQAPSLVSLLNLDKFINIGAACMADALAYTPGLQISTSCNNCGKIEARINGLDGNYTAIMMDSQPLSGGGGDSYSLEQIPENMIERIEIVRGGGSSLYGASAVGGVINIITRKPQKSGGNVSHTINVMQGGKTDNATLANIDLSKSEKRGISLYVQNRDRQGFDYNNDGFTDLTELETTTFGIRAYTSIGKRGMINAHSFKMRDKRRGGSDLDKEPHEAQIAEETKHKNFGTNVSYSWKSDDEKNDFSVMTALRHKYLNSYYGGIAGGSPEEREEALNGYGVTDNKTFDLQGLYSHDFKSEKERKLASLLTVGFQLNLDKIDDRAGLDNVNRYSQEVSTFGLLAQNEWRNDRVSILLGIRGDKDNVLEKPIFSPRATVRIIGEKGMVFRLSYANGYRSPKMYDNDIHQSLISGKKMSIRLVDGLKEEKSHSFSFSLNYNKRIIGLSAEAFFTLLHDCFAETIIENDDNTLTNIRKNVSGGKVMGVNVEAGITPVKNMNIQVGITAQDGRYDEDMEWSENAEPTKTMLRIPNVLGYLSADYRFSHHWQVGLTSRLVGAMSVAHKEGSGVDEDELVRTPTYGELGCRMSYTWCLPHDIDLVLTLGAKNLTGYYQKDLDKGYDRDSEYVYGPSVPRTGYLKIGLEF